MPAYNYERLRQDGPLTQEYFNDDQHPGLRDKMAQAIADQVVLTAKKHPAYLSFLRILKKISLTKIAKVLFTNSRLGVGTEDLAIKQRAESLKNLQNKSSNNSATAFLDLVVECYNKKNFNKGVFFEAVNKAINQVQYQLDHSPGINNDQKENTSEKEADQILLEESEARKDIEVARTKTPKTKEETAGYQRLNTLQEQQLMERIANVKTMADLDLVKRDIEEQFERQNLNKDDNNFRQLMEAIEAKKGKLFGEEMGEIRAKKYTLQQKDGDYGETDNPYTAPNKIANVNPINVAESDQEEDPWYEIVEMIQKTKTIEELEAVKQWIEKTIETLDLSYDEKVELIENINEVLNAQTNNLELKAEEYFDDEMEPIEELPEDTGYERWEHLEKELGTIKEDLLQYSDEVNRIKHDTATVEKLENEINELKQRSEKIKKNVPE